MSLWIRSQDKEKLININEHFSIEYTDVGMDKTQLKSIKYLQILLFSKCHRMMR